MNRLRSDGEGNNTTKKLLISIGIVLILLGVCMTIDSADTTIDNTNTTSLDNLSDKNIILVNESYVDLNNNSGWAETDGKIYTEKNGQGKPKPTITITARPSVRSKYAYKWYTTTWIDYCPHCHRYGVLYNAHKWQARHEQELTCSHCGADYCGVIGKEKYSWSHYYLTKA